MSILDKFKQKRKCWRIIKKYFPYSQDKNKYYKNIVQKYISKESILLDGGCGSGKETPVNYRDKVKIAIGIDLSKGIYQNNSLHEKIVGSVYQIPLRNSCLDIIVSQELIEHLEHPGRFFKEAQRILKNDGIFIIMTPNLFGWRSIISKCTPHRFHVLMNKQIHDIDGKDVFPTYYKANGYHRIREMLYKNNFRIIETHYYEGHPGTLTFSVITTCVEIAYTKMIQRYNILRALRETIIVVARKE